MMEDEENKIYNKHVNIITAKLLALAGIAIFSFICGLLPFPLVKWVYSHCTYRTRRLRIITTALICFSGGTLLGVAFLHLMPEMRDKIRKLESEGRPLKGSSFIPISDFLICIGFFFVYLFDELMHMLVEWCSKRNRKKQDVIESNANDNTALSSKATSVTDIHAVNIFSLDSHFSSFQTLGKTARFKITRSIKSDDPCFSPSSLNEVTREQEHAAEPRLEQNEVGIALDELDKYKPATILDCHCHEHDQHSVSHELETSHSLPALSGLITIVALSFHDIFEGLAIGIESSCEYVTFLFLSVAAHKYSIAFCIGLDLALSKIKLLVIILYMLTYSLVSPVGIIIGMVVVTGEEPTLSLRDINFFDTPALVIVQGLAGGTLIYIVCFEVLQRQGSDSHVKGLFNLFCVFCGFLLTLLLKIFLAHNQDELQTGSTTK